MRSSRLYGMTLELCDKGPIDRTMLALIRKNDDRDLLVCVCLVAATRKVAECANDNYAEVPGERWWPRCWWCGIYYCIWLSRLALMRFKRSIVCLLLCSGPLLFVVDNLVVAISSHTVTVSWHYHWMGCFLLFCLKNLIRSMFVHCILFSVSLDARSRLFWNTLQTNSMAQG